MNVNLHIERLILHGVDLDPAQRQQLQASVQTELTHLLSTGGLATQLTRGGALPSMVSSGLQLTRGNNSVELGRQIAGAVYGGIGK